MTHHLHTVSSLRRLRHNVVAGASAVALLGGLAVALAPATQAAGSLDINVQLDPATENRGAVQTGRITIINGTGGPIDLGTTRKWSTDTYVPNELGVRVSVKGTGITESMVQAGVVVTTTVAAGLTLGAMDWHADGARGFSAVDHVRPGFATAIDIVLAPDKAIDNGLFQLNFDTGVAELTGDVSVTVDLVALQGATDTRNPGAVEKVLGTTTATTTLSPPAAPTVVAPTAVPGASLHQAYAFQLGTPGIPRRLVILYDGTTPVSPVDGMYPLNNGLILDPVTLKVTRSASASDSLNLRPTRYRLVLNNGIGGATVGVTGTSGYSVALHDVQLAFVIPVRFVDDGSIAATLKTEVYTAATGATPITEGYADGTFRPAADVTRQTFAAFAARYLNSAAGTSLATSPSTQCTAANPSPFPDVANTAPFCAVIRDLAAVDVINGYANGTFKSTRAITRGAISAMLYRLNMVKNGLAADTPAAKPATAPFPDVPRTSFFAGEIAWASGAAITNGYPDGRFHPGANSSRQVTVVFLTRMP